MHNIDTSSYLDTLPGYVSIINLHNEYIYCNNAFADFFHLEKKDIIGFTHQMLFAALLNKKTLDAWDAHNAHAYTIPHTTMHEESFLLNDHYHVWLISRKPYVDAEGKITSLMISACDVTAYHAETRHTLYTTQMTLNTILTHSPCHIYWLNRDNIIMGCNDRQALRAGYQDRNELVGKTPYDLFDYDQAHMLCTTNNKVMDSGIDFYNEEPGVYVDGVSSTFLSHKVPLKDYKGDIVGMLGMSFDITETKKIANLEKLQAEAHAENLAKTKFLENIRHDIRTPLMGIVGFSDLLTTTTDMKEIHDYCQKLSLCSHELLNFLNEILESIHIESGDIPIVVKKFSLYDIFERILTLCTPSAVHKKLTLQFEYAHNLEKIFIGDPVRIYRIVLELITNAIKFTEQGSIHIHTECLDDDDTRTIVKITVQDTGIGMSSIQQEELFLRFRRIIPSYKGIYKGNGLGLASIKKFVDDIQAEIYVQSILHKGTAFEVVMSLRKPLLTIQDVEDII